MRGRAAPTDRDLREAQRLRQKAGSRAEYLRWGEGKPSKRGKRGRPRDEFFTDFSVSKWPGGSGLYTLWVKTAKDPQTFVLIVRPRRNRVKPGGPKRTWVEAHPKNSDYPTPFEAIRAFVKKYGEPTALKTTDEDSIARRLKREFRKAGLRI